MKRNILCLKIVFRRFCLLWDNEEKYGTAGQATDGNIIKRTGFTCWIIKVTCTHREYETHIAYPRQQWLHERASMLSYTYIACSA